MQLNDIGLYTQQANEAGCDVQYIPRRERPLPDAPFGSMPHCGSRLVPDWEGLAQETQRAIDAADQASPAQIIPIIHEGQTQGVLVVTQASRPSIHPSPTRLRAEVAIACPGLPPEAFDAACRAAGAILAREFAGCTIHRGVGFWSPDGNKPLGPYRPPAEEPVMWIAVSVMPDQRQRAEAVIAGIAERLRDEHRLDIQHVHVDWFAVTAAHVALFLGPTCQASNTAHIA